MVSQSQFGQMFPGHNAFYSYQGLTDALERQDRINVYKQFTGILGVDAGGNLSC